MNTRNEFAHTYTRVCVCLYKIITITGTYSGSGFILKTIWRGCYIYFLSTVSWENQGTVKLSNITKTTQLINNKTWIQIQSTSRTDTLNRQTLTLPYCVYVHTKARTCMHGWVQTSERQKQRGKRMGNRIKNPVAGHGQT